MPPEVVADYVDYRRRALPVREDRSVLLGGRQPVWEIAARILARGFGRLGTPVRPLLVDPLTRALSASDQPCLVDGDALPGLLPATAFLATAVLWRTHRWPRIHE